MGEKFHMAPPLDQELQALMSAEEGEIASSRNHPLIGKVFVPETIYTQAIETDSYLYTCCIYMSACGRSWRK